MRFSLAICAVVMLFLCSGGRAIPADAARSAMAYEKGAPTAYPYKKKKKRYYKYRKSSKYKHVRRSATPASRETMAAVEAMDSAPLVPQPVRTWTIISPWPVPEISQVQKGDQSPFPAERFEAVFAPAPAPLSVPEASPRRQRTDPRWFFGGLVMLVLMLIGGMFIPITRLRGAPEPLPRKDVIILDHHRRRKAV